MPLKVSEVLNRRKEIDVIVPAGDTDDAVLKVTVNTNAMTPTAQAQLLELVKEVDKRKKSGSEESEILDDKALQALMEQNYQFLAMAVIDWDMTEDDGVTKWAAGIDNYRKLPFTVLMPLLKAVNEALSPNLTKAQNSPDS